MKKILIIRFSSIGDIVLTTPVIRCLATQLPQVEIHYLTKKIYTPLLEANPYIHHLHLYDGNLRDIQKKLKQENFDVIIDLHKNLRTFLVKMALGKKSYSFNKINLQKWLMVNFKINILPDKHIVDRYMETVKPLQVTNDGKGLDYFIPQKDEINLESLPATHQPGYIAFVIGAKFNTKKLPVRKIIAICQKIEKPIILLGGAEDRSEGHEVSLAAGELVYNACGKYSISQSASLVRQAQAVISHDTGLMHIAAAFKKNIVSVWGNTIPEFGMSPYLPISDSAKSKIFEVQKLPCRPCSKLGYSKCPQKHFLCMESHDEVEIKDFLYR